MKHMDPAQTDDQQAGVSVADAQPPVVPQQPAVQAPVQPVSSQQQEEKRVSAGLPVADSTPAQAPPVTPVQQAQAPISGPHKERAPLAGGLSDEYVMPTEVEPVLHPEVKEAGVEKSVDVTRADLTDEHKSLGIEHAKEAVPVQATPTSHIQVPWTPEEIKKIEHSRRFWDSLYWLVRLFVKEEKRDKKGEIAH